MRYPYEDLYTAWADAEYDSWKDSQCSHDCSQCGEYIGECYTAFWNCETRKTDLCAKCKAKATTA